MEAVAQGKDPKGIIRDPEVAKRVPLPIATPQQQRDGMTQADWMADHGLEWIFRLGIEPRRMWRRYLLGNPMFLWRVMNERQDHRDGPVVETGGVPFETVAEHINAFAHGGRSHGPLLHVDRPPREARGERRPAA